MQNSGFSYLWIIPSNQSAPSISSEGTFAFPKSGKTETVAALKPHPGFAHHCRADLLLKK